MITSCVQTYNGLPTLFINGKPVRDPAYTTYLPERNEYKEMAATGSHLYTLTIYFGAQCINETSQIHPFAPGIFDKKGEADFSVPDREIRRILDADPEALIFPRINTSLPRWWEEENPDELNDEGYKGNRRRCCFSSKKWLHAVEEGLRLTVEHVEASDYVDHIFGYQVAGGQTEEWISFDNKGSIGLRAREAWEREKKPGDGEAEFYEYLSRVTCDNIAYLSGKMKEFTGRKLVIGSFYGYTFETPYRASCHAALSRLLRCPDLDFLCSPMSYAGTRKHGVDHACMTVLESILLHGKLYFNETDERTHLTRPLCECRENACEPGTYIGGVWEGPKDAFTARHLLRNDFGRHMAHGNNFWWFSMWGQWYDEDMLADFGEAVKILREEKEDKKRGLRTDVAVFVDETFHFLSHNGTEGAAAHQFRIPLGSAGTSYASYEISDFEEVYRNYRAFILIEPQKTEGMNQVKEKLAAEGRPFMVVTNETELSSALFRDFYRANGVHLYVESDDVIHAGWGSLSIHASEAGEKTVRLPEKMRIQPCYGEGEAFEADEIRVTMKQYETRLFRLLPLA